MTKYTFIRIVNNKDPRDYYIDCTSVKKWRTRVSGLKTHMYLRGVTRLTRLTRCFGKSVQGDGQGGLLKTACQRVSVSD